MHSWTCGQTHIHLHLHIVCTYIDTYSHITCTYIYTYFHSHTHIQGWARAHTDTYIDTCTYKTKMHMQTHLD